MQYLIKEKNIKLILLAITNIKQSEQKLILRKIVNFPAEVKVISSIESIISGK